MELSKAIEILRQHNNWRRDRNDINAFQMVNPTELGVAIDVVVKHYEETKDT